MTMATSKVVQSFLAGCRARGLSPRTIAWYQCLLLAFANKYPRLPDKPDRIEYFLGAPEISDELRHGRFRALRAFYSWASQRLEVPNPMTQISTPRKRKKLPRTLTLTDMGCLLLAPLSRRDRTMITLVLDTGIRIGELVGMDSEDIGEETIFVSGKTGQRQVPISDETRGHLLEMASSGPLFRGPKGRLTTSGAYQAIRQALIRAGISGKKLGPHTLRHTFGRQWIVAGGDLVSLQRILGHASISTTRIYTELDLGDVLGQHHRFTPLIWATSAVQGQLFSNPASREPVGARILSGGRHG
jgi:integrase/recombinase XerD